jgi:hypothetical protein
MFKRKLFFMSIVGCLCAGVFHNAWARRGGRNMISNGLQQRRCDGQGPHALSGRAGRGRALMRDGSGPHKDGRGPRGTMIGARKNCPVRK